MPLQTNIRLLGGSLTELRIYALPTKPVKIKQAVRVGDHYVLLSETGRIYSTQILVNRWNQEWSPVERLDDTIQGLIKMGLLTEEQIAQHKEAAKAETEANRRRYACDAILDHIDDCGIEFTEVQRDALVERASKYHAPKTRFSVLKR